MEEREKELIVGYTGTFLIFFFFYPSGCWKTIVGAELSVATGNRNARYISPTSNGELERVNDIE